MPNKPRRCFRLSRYLVAGSVALLALPAAGQDHYLSGAFFLNGIPSPAGQLPEQDLVWWYTAWAPGDAEEVPFEVSCTADLVNETTEGLRGVSRIGVELSLEDWDEVSQEATKFFTDSGRTGRGGQKEFTASLHVANHPPPWRHFVFSKTKTDGKKRAQGLGTTCVLIGTPEHICESGGCIDKRWLTKLFVDGVEHGWTEQSDGNVSFPEVSTDQGPIDLEYVDNCDQRLLQERTQGFETSGITSDEVKIVITDTKTGEQRIAQRAVDGAFSLFFDCP